MEQALDYSKVGTLGEGGVVGYPETVWLEKPLPHAVLDTLDLPTRANKGERASWVRFVEGDIQKWVLNTTLGTYTVTMNMDMKLRLFFSNLIYTGQETSTEIMFLDGWNKYMATHKTLYRHGRDNDREICIQNINDFQDKYANKIPNNNMFSGKPYVPSRRAQGFMKKAMLTTAICADYMELAEAGVKQ